VYGFKNMFPKKVVKVLKSVWGVGILGLVLPKR